MENEADIVARLVNRYMAFLIGIVFFPILLIGFIIEKLDGRVK